MPTCGQCYHILKDVNDQSRFTCNRYPPNFADAAVRLFYLNGLPLITEERPSCGEFHPKQEEQPKLSTNLFADIPTEGLENF